MPTWSNGYDASLSRMRGTKFPLILTPPFGEKNAQNAGNPGSTPGWGV